MSSLLENYKKVNDLDYESDLNVIRQLYKDNEDYQKKYSFEEFVTYATQNSANKLDGSLSKHIDTPKYTQRSFGQLLGQSLVKPSEASTALANSVKDLTKEEVAELMPLKNVRRTIGGVIDKVATGTISFVGEGLAPINLYEQVSGNKFRIKTKEDILAEEEQRKTKTQEAVSSVLRPVMTLGTDDIYDGEEIQRPEGMVGRLGVDFGSFLVAMRNPKQFSNFLKKDKPKVEPKKPRGRPSKASIKAANIKALKDKKIKALKGLGRAEYASQVVFAEDPEMQFVAGLLKDKLGTFTDDNLLGDVLEYLDTDETSTAGQRRLSLLFDGAAFLGLIKSVVLTGKAGKYGTEKTYGAVLNEIKKDPKKVQALKTYLRDPIQKVVPSFKSNIVDDVFVKTSESGILKSPLNVLRQIRRKYGTSRGYYSEEMFNIFKSAGYDKIAWSKQGENLFNELQYQIKQISQTGKFTKDEVETLLGKYLAGDVKALNGTSKEFKKLARQTRNKIDELSASLLETKVIPEELKRVIRLNMGSYLRQSYELFENPNFKPSEEVILKAKDYIAGLLREAPTQTEMFGTVGKLTPSQIEVKASNIVDDILSKGVRNKGIDTDIVKHFNDVFGVQKANIKFATRENIAKPLQDLMGRRGLTDTSKSVFNTIETLGHYITEVKMYDDMFKRGEGKWFFKNGINTLDNNAQRVAGTISGEGFGALNNMSTTPQIAKLFDKMNKVQKSDLFSRGFQLLLGAKGWGQASATVYSLTTHARNTIGGGLIMASNGLNPFDAETRKAFKTLQNELFTSRGKSKKELEKIYVKYQKLGLVNQSVQVGEFKRNINSAAFLDDYIRQQNENFSRLAYGSTSNLIKNVTNKISKVYVAEDDLWRIAAFEKELAVLKRANNLRTAPKTVAQLEQEAATIIRNTMPTYDLVPAGFQELRAMPFGNFYSFFAERWRNSYHSLTQGLKEVKSGNAELVERGYQRLASQIVIGYTGAEGVNQFSKYAFGVSDEEEQAIKDLALPYWSKNSTIGYQRDKDGNIQWVDLSFTDPQAPIIDVFKNGLDEFLNPDTPDSTIDDKLGNAIIQSGLTLAKPFMTEALFTERLLEAYTGRDNQTGRFVEGYNPTNSSFDNAMAITWHVGGVLVPRFIREGFSYTAGEKAEKLKEGDLNYNNELLSKVTGQRFYTVNSKTVKDNLYFKAREFNKIQEQVSSGFEINKGDTTEDIINKYVRQNENYYNYQVDFNKALKAANTLNLDSLEMSNTIKRTLTNFNSIEKQSFLLGDDTFKPLRLNNFDFNTVFKMDDRPNISYLDFVELYSNTYQKLSNLPLIEKNEYSKQEQEALEMVNPPMRVNKVEGGLIEGEDVPYTKENPADRVDSFTGSPYSDQMARLGLAEGGLTYEEQMNRLGFATGGGVLFSNIIDAIKEKAPAEARLYFDKVIKQNKKPITESDFTEKEYNNIKNHFKQTLINDIKSGKLTFDKEGNAQYIRKNKKGNNFTKPFISGYTPVKRKATELEIGLGMEPKPSDGNVKDFTNVFGDASYSFKKDNYENATASINDVYDFNFEYGGGFNSDKKYKRGSNIHFNNSEVRLLKDTKEKAGILNPINRAKYISSFKSIKPKEILRGNLNSLRPVAERYAAFRLPDEKTAEKLEKEYSPVNVKVNIPIKDIFTKEEYDSLFTEKTSNQMDRLNFDEGGQTNYKSLGIKYTKDPFIAKIIGVESSGNPNAISPVGAKGLMQIMEHTAKQPGFGVKPFKGNDLLNPEENVRFGTDYIYALTSKLGNKRDAAIAYNWGYGNTKKWLEQGADLDKLPKETRNYIRKLELD